MQYIVVKFNKIIFNLLIINTNYFDYFFKKIFFKVKKPFFSVFLMYEVEKFKV